MGKKYTAADFANAQFAEHPDGRIAARLQTEEARPWESVRDFDTDEGMAADGWVPVPTKPTITESQYRLALDEDRDPQYVYGFADAMRLFGGEIIPDPEPTNTELIADALVDGFERDEFTLTSSFRVIAASLATRGITAPNVKGN